MHENRPRTPPSDTLTGIPQHGFRTNPPKCADKKAANKAAKSSLKSACTRRSPELPFGFESKPLIEQRQPINAGYHRRVT